MLKMMRSNVKILTYIVIVAVVVWMGYGVISSGQMNPYVGVVFGKKVTLKDYQKAYLAARTRAIFTYGDKLREVQKDLNLEEDAWTRLIMLYEAKKEKIKIEDKEVTDLIKDIALFKDKNDKFDYPTYEEILKYGFGITPTDFEGQIRDDLIIQKLVEKQTKDVALTDDDALKEYKRINEKAKAAYILFPSSDYLSKVTVTEDELKSYFEKNKDAFVIPEQVNVEYFGKSFPNDKEETKDKIRKELKDISYEFAGETDFGTVGKKYSLPIKETGFFERDGKIADIGRDLDFADVAFSLTQGQISGPVETKSGVYILKSKEKKPARPAQFNEIKDKVEKALKSEKADAAAKEKADAALTQIKTAMSANEKFEDAAKKLFLTVKVSEPFTRNSYIEGLGISPEFEDAVFSVKEGEVFGQAVKTHSGYAIVKQAALIPIDENKYNEEKDKFKEQLLAQKKYFKSITWLFELRKRANLQSNLDNLRRR